MAPSGRARLGKTVGFEVGFREQFPERRTHSSSACGKVQHFQHMPGGFHMRLSLLNSIVKKAGRARHLPRLPRATAAVLRSALARLNPILLSAGPKVCSEVVKCVCPWNRGEHAQPRMRPNESAPTANVAPTCCVETVIAPKPQA